jgi:hypothetical protein
MDMRTAGGSQADPYAVLGVARSASEAEIKSAYRALAKIYHPDLSAAGAANPARFRTLTEAYELLLDSTRRAAYDQHGHEAPPEEEPVSRPSPGTSPPPSGWGGQRRPRYRGASRSKYASSQPYGSTGRRFSVGGWIVAIGMAGMCAACLLLFFMLPGVSTPGALAALDMGHAGPGEKAPPIPAVTPPPVETLPEHTQWFEPAVGLLIPEQAKLKMGFAAASEENAYFQNGYKTIYRLLDQSSQQTLAFTETLGHPYEIMPGGQLFEYMGAPGNLTLNRMSDGLVEGTLHWDDHNSDLSIHIIGGPAEMTAHDLLEMMAALRRVTPKIDPVTSAPAANLPSAFGACHPGSVCYDQRFMPPGRHWLLRRGRHIDDPS